MNSTTRIYLQGAAVGLSIGILFVALGFSGSQSSLSSFAYYVLSGAAVLLSDALLTNASFAQIDINVMVVVYWIVLSLIVATIARRSRLLATYAGIGVAVFSIGLGVYLFRAPVFG